MDQGRRVTLFDWVAIDRDKPNRAATLRAADFVSAKREGLRRLGLSWNPERVRVHVVAQGESPADALGRLRGAVAKEHR